MDINEFGKQVCEILEQELQITIQSDDEELDIDSFTMMLVITFIEEEAGVKLDMDTLDFDAFTSLGTLKKLAYGDAVAA
jgi:acyl carrier protein